MDRYAGWPSWLPLLDFIDEEVSIHSMDGAILHVNRKLLNGGESLAEEFVGRRCDEAFPVGSCPHVEALARKEPVELHTSSGAGHVGRRVTIVPFFGETGEAEGFARIACSSNALAPSHEALLKAERFATLGQMMAGIAHDVGTPLNIISGYAEYLLMRTPSQEAGHKELTAILEQTRRVAEYIRIMLDLSRPSHGRADAIELRGFLGDSLDLMGSHLRKVSVQASLTCKTGPPVIYGDGARLRQAFFSLVLNAGRRVGAGGRLELVIEQFSDMPDFVGVMLLVTDKDGLGTDCSETFAGFLAESKWGAEDVGLALAKEILDECGAKVAAPTVAGRGVALVVYLPKVTGGRTAAGRSE